MSHGKKMQKCENAFYTASRNAFFCIRGVTGTVLLACGIRRVTPCKYHKILI